MATRTVRCCREQAVVNLGAYPGGGFMARHAISAGDDVVSWFPRRYCAVVAAQAVRRWCEQTVVDLRANPRGRFVAGAAVGSGRDVVAWLS